MKLNNAMDWLHNRKARIPRPTLNAAYVAVLAHEATITVKERRNRARLLALYWQHQHKPTMPTPMDYAAMVNQMVTAGFIFNPVAQID